MGKKKKIEKSIKSFEKQIKKHKEKLENYQTAGGKDYALIDYWEQEIERLKKFKEDEEEKLED